MALTKPDNTHTRKHARILNPQGISNSSETLCWQINYECGCLWCWFQRLPYFSQDSKVKKKTNMECAESFFLLFSSSYNFCNMLYLFSLSLSDGGFQNHSRLRTPPLPLSHSHSPNHQHHAASINSLNRGNYTPRSNPSPAPTDSSAPPEGPASGQDSGSAQDNWLLNSNIPLETRYRATCHPDDM